MKVGFISLGCSKNQVDTELMIGLLNKANYQITSILEEAEIIIINTCGFITSAQEEAVNTIIEIGQLKQKGILRYLVATGCLSQFFGQELMKEMPELDAVVGISFYLDIVNILKKVQNGVKICKVESPQYKFLPDSPRILTTPPGMAYLKIAEGCNNRCSYCAIPLIRGRLLSKPIDYIIQEAQQLADQGVKELVVIGQDTAAYGNDLDKKVDLSLLLEKLADIKAIKWIRLMYLHPHSINEKLLETINAYSQVVPYFDIPVQHISDKILKRMHRHENSQQIIDLFYKLKDKFNNPILRTTVMTGFPGETDADFEKLYNFVEKTEFDWLGAFIFDPQDGTAAYNMAERVANEISAERRSAIMKLQRGITRKKNLQRINRVEEILITTRLKDNLYVGRGYFQAPDVDGVTLVKSEGKLDKGNFVKVKLKAIRNYDMIGESLDEYTK